MKRFFLTLALVLLTQPVTAIWANTLPETIGYTIFQEGKNIGHCAITVTESTGELVLESKTKVKLGKHNLELNCRTVADPQTYLIRSFDFHGNKSGAAIDGTVRVLGDSIFGTFLVDEQEMSNYKLSPYGKNLFLEDFVMDHEVLIALAHSKSESNPAEYGLLFPLNLTMSKCTVAFASTVEIESDIKGAVCKKLLVSADGASPFASYFDPKRNIPVYLAFPQTNVEVFLDEFFGDSPVSRYR